MAHIVRYCISHLAGHETDVEHELNPDVNVFFGLNGSGKTSLLRILHSALNNDASLVLDVPFMCANVTIHSGDYEQDFTYTLDKRELRTRRQTPGGFAEVVDIDGERHIMKRRRRARWKVDPELPRKHRKWKHTYLPTSRLHFPTEPSEMITFSERRVSPTEEPPLDYKFEAYLEHYWLDFFGEIQAEVRQAQQGALVDVLRQVLATAEYVEGEQYTPPDWETAYEEVVSFLKRQNPRARPPSKEDFGKRYAKSPLLRTVIRRIDQVERDVEQLMAPRTRLQKLVDRMFSGNKRLEWGETSVQVLADNQEDIGLRALSSGEKHLLYILLHLTRSSRSAVVIDEPEISMHIDWQRELIPAMRELIPDAQIIAATHSPEIMVHVEDSKIFNL